MGSFTKLKVERDNDEFVRQDDNVDRRNGEMRESSSQSSLVASIPIGNREVGEGETPPVDILEEASRISSEVTRLVGELALCKVKCSEQSKELEKCREKIDIQNVQLQKAEELISNLQNQVEELEGMRREDGEVDRVDLREMKEMVATERAEKLALQTKFDKLKSSMEQFSKEFVSVVSKVKELSAEKSDGEEDDYEDIPLQENKLEGIMEFAKNKFQVWAANQEKLKSELKSMTQLVQSLAGILEIKESEEVQSASPRRRSSRKIMISSTPELPPMKISPKTLVVPPAQSLLVLPTMKISPKKSVAPRAQFVAEDPPLPIRQNRRAQNHGVDNSKTGEGFFCLCGVQYSTRSNLKTHISSFTEIGHFICPQCDFRCVHLYILRRHQRDRHKIIVKKPSWGCTKCGKVFPNQLTLTKHRKQEHTTHSQEGIEGENESLPQPDQAGDMEWEDVPETVPIITKVASSSARRSKFKLNHGYCPTNLLGCLCGRKFVHKYRLRKHVRYYTTDRKFVCDCCPQRCLNASELRIHQRSAHKIVLSTATGTGCSKCGELFPTLDSYRKHRKDCSGHAANPPLEKVEPEINDAQSKRVNFSGKRHGMNIARRHQGFYCICGDKFISRKRLDGHIEFFNRGRPKYREVESDYEEDEGFQAEEPEFDHSQFEDYDEEQLDEDPGQFEIPEESEPQPSTSKASVTHAPHPSRVNQCLCGYKGSNRDNLRKHINYYTLEKVFKCDYCPQAFNDVSHLRDHIPRLHKHVTMDQLKKMRTGCRRCGQIFPGKDALRRHKQTEHGTDTGSSSTPHKMPKKRCHSFAEPSVNKRQCVAGQIFTCPHCDNIGFPQLHPLNKHMKVVHGITSKLIIGCRDCGIGFSDRKSHSQHRISVHGSAIGKSKQMQLAMKNANSSMPLEEPADRFQFDQEEEMEGLEEMVLDNEQAAYVEDKLCPIPITITIEDEDDDDYGGDMVFNDEIAVNLKTEVDQDPPQGPLLTAGPQPVGDSQDDHRADFSQADLGIYSCSCGHSYSLRTNLMTHIRQQQPDQLKFPCHLCSRQFMFPSVLNRHLVRMHKINQNTSKPGPSSQALIGKDLPRHGIDVSKASQGYYCLCGRNCNSERALKVHIANSTQETSHQRKVTVARPATSGWTRKKAAVKKPNFRKLWCKPCGKYFKDRALHYQHMKTFHPEKLRKIEKPEGPSRVMWRISQTQVKLGLKPAHMDATVEGGPPTCSCRREYNSTSGLAKHIRLLNRGDIFKCNWCDKRFSQNVKLRQHCEKTHNKVIPEGAQVCGVCNQICESLSALSKHRREAHFL